MTRRPLLPWALLLPAALAIALFLIAPLADTFSATFATAAGPFAPYQRFFAGAFNQQVLLRTLRIAALTTLIAVLLGFPAAYVIAKARASLKSILIIAAIFPLLTGTVVRSFAWIVILGREGLINRTLATFGFTDGPVALLYTETAVVIGLVYLFSPLMILALVGVLENIEGDLLRAAASLGAGPVGVFRQVVLPLAVPGLIVGAVLVFTGSFTAYTTPQLLGGEKQTVMATLLYRRAMVSLDWVAASTVAAVMVVVTVAVVLGLGRVARRLNPAAG